MRATDACLPNAAPSPLTVAVEVCTKARVLVSNQNPRALAMRVQQRSRTWSLFVRAVRFARAGVRSRPRPHVRLRSAHVLTLKQSA